MSEVSECKCYYCSRHRELNKVKKTHDFDKMAALAEEFICRAMNAEDDAEYYRAILGGTWPSAKKILQKALDKLENG